MLNDLQQRQGEQKADLSQTSAPVVRQQKTNANTVLIVIVSIVLTLIAVYMLKLHDENQQYKNEQSLRNQQNTLNINKPSPQKTIIPSAKIAVQQPLENELPIAVDEKPLPVSQAVLPMKNIVVAKQAKKENKENKDGAAQLLTSAGSPPLIDTTPSPVKKSSMTISRQQMTPESLAKQKMNRAKEAVANNELAKAEQLFEDVLLVLPSHQGARKQLAALWFGRRAYQAAINLLAQGIYLDPASSELRQLKAQIYSKQNMNKQAFQVLQNLPKVEQFQQLEYQSLLASSAQKSQQYDYASEAYKRLTLMQPKVGRWWLGLAIANDSNSQFLKASDAYQQALLSQDLSSSAMQFVQRRMKELGE
jgi:MSHA biogenesis protein MshN